MSDTPCEYPILHRYTESSARAKLARHRKRGDTTLAIIGCPGTDHWHCCTPTIPGEPIFCAGCGRDLTGEDVSAVVSAPGDVVYRCSKCEATG